MASGLESAQKVSFGLFEADLQTGELWKAGRRVKLQSQPFKVLTALLERPGEVISREELQLRLWGRDTVVDFDHSIGTAINKIRDALNDSADNPRFVETLARRGYRFIAPVSILERRPAVQGELSSSVLDLSFGQQGSTDAGALDGAESSPALPTAPQVRPSIVTPEQPVAVSPVVLERKAERQPITAAVSSAKKRWRFAAAAVGVTIAAAGAGFWAGLRHTPPEPVRIRQVTSDGRIFPGAQSMESLPASATDGLRIYASVLENGRTALSQVEVSGGSMQPLEIPSEIASPSIGDISPDGTRLLVRSHLSPESEQPLWVIPTGGGSALRVSNVLAHDAAWMPDGKGILYASGNTLWVTHLEDGKSQLFAKLPFGRAFWMRWSPDGSRLRFTVFDPIAHTFSLWELAASDHRPHPLLAGWNSPSSECCGVWTGDGEDYIFQSSRDGNPDLWRMTGGGNDAPRRITNGPLAFQAPFASRIGRRIYFLGLDSRSQLAAYNAEHSAFLPEHGFLSDAQRVSWSRDGKWVAWTDGAGRLWRAHPDGSEKIQVTPDSLVVFLAHWSPDGQQLALMAREPGHAWTLYTVSADGGAPTQLLEENRNAADPDWSADGKQIVFGRVTDLMGKEDGDRRLELLDLASHTVTAIPGSKGLFSPRWSPDGRYISAISLDQRRLMLFNTATRQWSKLVDSSVADPVWTPDSHALFFHASMLEKQPIFRVSIPDGHQEKVADLADFRSGDTADYFFVGLLPGNVPLVRGRTSTGNIYMLDLDK